LDKKDADTIRDMQHPLDPLSALEQEQIVAHAQTVWNLQPFHVFSSVQLEEPTKEEIRLWESGLEIDGNDQKNSIDRTVRVTIWNPQTALVSEGLITVDGTVKGWKEIPGVKALVTNMESDAAIKVASSDPGVLAALKRRGIDSAASVHMEAWPIGASIPAHLDDGRRLIWTPMWQKITPNDNFYAHPISGLHAIVDIDALEVVGLEDQGDIPVPQKPGPYRADQTGGDIHLKPLVIHQPDGPSFIVEDWKVTWERWQFRIGFDQREGLVIHDVHFEDTNGLRKIAHRLSISELVIPYGDPSQGTYRKNAFDTGEYGLGNFTNSLILGCDCLGEIYYLDVAVTESDGTVRTIKNGICMHEEDFGILWKHVDVDGHTEVRRARRFVASSIVTVNNYEYGYFWYFYQDGSIEFEAKLTGIVLTVADHPGADHPSATEIEPGLFAPYHQHILCARLDLDIDGSNNSVLEVDSFAHPRGEKNPHGGAFETIETLVKSEQESGRLLDVMKSRYWKIVNPSRKNHVNQPVGYKLVPGHNTYPLTLPESVLGKRAGFMYKHLWVTKQTMAERYPAGDYPFAHAGGAGIPEWVSANRNLEDEDLVLWYVFGTNHIPRTEDWPVMPVERVGFHLKPSGFFARSPAMDVAPSS